MINVTVSSQKKLFIQSAFVKIAEETALMLFINLPCASGLVIIERHSFNELLKEEWKENLLLNLIYFKINVS